MGLGEQERTAIEQLARRFADERLAPRELEDDRYPFAPWNAAAWSSAAELGLPGLVLPERCGGSDQGLAAFCRVLEIVAQREAGHAAVLLTQALARTTLLAAKPSSLAAPWGMLRGDASESLLGFPLYEDPEEPGQAVRASERERGFVLDGELPHVACALQAEAWIVPAVIASSGARALFLVPRRTAGVEVSEPVVMLGLRACPAADLTLSAVELEASACLGIAEDDPWPAAVERFRPALVAVALGVLRASYELAFAYAQDRKQAKRRIVQHHMVQELLSGMASTLDLGTLALERACQLSEAHPRGRGTELLSLQELVTTLITRAATDGVQVLGGNGYMHDYGQEKHMRDAKQLQAVFGSSATRRLRVLERRLLAATHGA